MDASQIEAALGRAMAFARRSLANGSYPVGSVIVAPDGRVVGGGANRTAVTGVPTDHAEMGAIRQARAALATAGPGALTLVTTGEPCLMCLGAILQTPAIGTVVWAFGPVSPAGSAMAAVRSTSYNAQWLSELSVIAEPSPQARSASARLLYRWCIERGDPRAALFAEASGSAGGAEPAAGTAKVSPAGGRAPAQGRRQGKEDGRGR